MVIWLTGISGSGKTTLAKGLLKSLYNRKKKFIVVDGDEIRELFGNDLGYHINDRKKQIKRIQTLCKFLDKQGVDVIASALFFSEEISSWNRSNFSSYYEIYIKASIKTVSKKDEKGIYRKARLGMEKNVVGLDIKWIEPKNPFLVIDRETGIRKEDMIKEIFKQIPNL